MRSRSLTISDRVYEHITLPPIVIRAVDTTYFQRLRGLKQLGVSSFLYPSAVHTRFEHSIGVAYLAQRFLETIRKTQPELQISDRDVELAMLAGLCHDIGHGPFSHLFEDVITRSLSSSSSSSGGSESGFCHEAMGQRVARRMLSGILSDDEVEVVLDLMGGGDRGSATCGTVPFVEIISNKRNGIDVDKLDYFIRDSVCCFGKPTVDVRVSRLFNSCRLVPSPAASLAATSKKKPLPAWEMIFEEKMALTLREVFALRAKLHKHVYQHQVVKCIGHMMGDAIAAAVPFFRVGGKSLAECCADVDAFSKLGDWIVEAIESSADRELAPSQEIIRRIRCRELYKLVLCKSLKLDEQISMSSSHIEDAVRSEVAKIAGGARAREVSFLVDVVEISHGKGAADPLRSVRFFNPKAPWTTYRASSSSEQLDSQSFRTVEAGSSPLFHPMAFLERTVMVFVRNPQHVSDVAAACEVWRAREEAAGSFTPAIPFLNSSSSAATRRSEE